MITQAACGKWSNADIKPMHMTHVDMLLVRQVLLG